MILKKIDIFSKPFLFNIGNGQLKQKTILGSFFSIITIVTCISYLIFLLQQYLNNGINPNFNSQVIVSPEPVSITLTEDLLAFRYERKSINIEQYQAQQNKTYLVIKVYFQFVNETQNQVIPLNFYQCQNANLVGYNCIDFSSLQDQLVLTADTNNTVYTQLFFGVYGCYDIDTIKTTIPDNCASQNDIEDLINSDNTAFTIKYFSQQFQIQNKKIQSNYYQAIFNGVGNSVTTEDILLQKQITQLKDGLIFQTTSTFSSLLPSSLNTSAVDREYSIQKFQQSGYLQIQLSTDVQVKYISIQYPSITQILAQVNSLYSFFVILGLLAKNIAQKLLKKKLFLLFLQNQYQETYEKIMQYNKLFEQNQGVYFQKQANDEPGDEKEDFKNQQNNNIPTFQIKQKEFQFSKSCNQIELQENFKLVNEDYSFQTLERSDFQQLQQSIESLQIKKQQPNQSIVNLKQDSPLQMPKMEKNSLSIKKINQPQPSKDQTSYQGQLITNKKLNYRKDQPFQIHKRKKSQLTIGYINEPKSQGLQQNNLPNQNTKILNNQLTQYYVDKLKALQNPNSLRIIQKLLFKMGKKSQQDDLNYQTRKKLEDKFNSEIDIFNLYKDIIFLKKAIMILLSKDQLAALQLVGCQIDSQDPQKQDIKQELKIQSNVRKKNYYEEQLSILQSQELQCNGQKKQSTILGSFFSIITITTCISYLVFLILEYINNQIDPNFNSQVLVSSEPVTITLTEDMFAFKYEYQSMSIEQYQAQQNKTYLVIQAYFQFHNGTQSQIIPLNFYQCQNVNLKGYNCIDFTSLQDQFTLTLDNINQIFNQIAIGVYGCYDIDLFKTTIPDNCASQNDIENLINFGDSYLIIKYFTQQYQIQQKNKQTNYQQAFLNGIGNQILFWQILIQKQITQLKEGLIFQTSSTFSSPSSLAQQSQAVDRQYSIQNFQISGYLQIQLCADVQNQYQDTYEKIMQYNNLFQQNQGVYFQKETNDEPDDEQEDFKNTQNYNIPQFQTKLNSFQFCNSINQIKFQENFKLENEEQSFQTLQERNDFQQPQLSMESTLIKKKQLNQSNTNSKQDFFKDSPLQMTNMKKNSLSKNYLNQTQSPQDQTSFQDQFMKNQKLNNIKDCPIQIQKKKKIHLPQDTQINLSLRVSNKIINKIKITKNKIISQFNITLISQKLCKIQIGQEQLKNYYSKREKKVSKTILIIRLEKCLNYNDFVKQRLTGSFIIGWVLNRFL
ncbi:transmembrane protein, putative (macronuclear) [Tetrahymena thermophila SB210]|uniref:Transmembrane protein, putative n=1 Tax=Tetrahymena thermophila (strain SB210) TaxID=312017 RepID=W7X3E6_TETTS|nr:transmembrane protein, putative [Tetrahymena thermophila SB210]EWS71977.1 transmembrane protein, putative [Tetrahymena thermophila SB210]|eukprot:XP_012655477.1 transmembrane protein, putative [Tetrahymena thermophila SB210]